LALIFELKLNSNENFVFNNELKLKLKLLLLEPFALMLWSFNALLAEC